MTRGRGKQYGKLLKGMIFGGICMGGMTFALTGCGKQVDRQLDRQPDRQPAGQLSGEPVDFEEIEISTHGMEIQENVYHITKTETGIHLKHYYRYSSWDENAGETVDTMIPIRELDGDRELLEQIQKLAGECGMEDWDGFSGSNPYVLDGTTFSCRVLLADGRTIFASGSNSFPEHFQEFYNTVVELLQYAMVEDTQFQGQGFTMTLPESWVDEVRISYFEDGYCFALPVEDQSAYLFRVDVKDWGYTDSNFGENIQVGRLLSGEEERYITFYIYGNPGMPREKLSEAQKAICDSLKGVIPQILESLESKDGYRIERE